MGYDFTVPSELFTAFNNVNYYDEPHKYYVNNRQLISVTTLIHKYEEEFNDVYWSEYKGNQYNLKPFEVKRAWNFINKKGTIKGSATHDYTENLFLNKTFKYPNEIILNEFGFDPIKNEYDLTKKLVDKFYSDIHGKLIPIRTEFVVYDKETFIGGMLDMLFWNVKAQEFQIWDWKSNKDFSFECKKRHLTGDLFLLEACDLEIYSLQLGLYKYIIEKYIPIKLGKSYLVWFSHNNDNYRVIATKDRSYYVNLMVENRKSELLLK